jgi:asparagine synthase (glutamine-hydrolysing)
LVKRTPWIYLAMRAAALLVPSRARARLTHEGKLAPWIDNKFAARWQLSLRQLGPLGRYRSLLPSRQECARTVIALARTQANDLSCTSGAVEKRYPYLDQDLVGFLSSIPREQLIRPGQRRSLMRRALAGLVPDEVLSRRTKGTVARRPLVAIANDWQELDRLLGSSLSAQCGYVDPAKFRNALLTAKSGNAPQLLPLLRTLSLELWLQDAVLRRVIHLPGGTLPDCSSIGGNVISGEAAQPGTI